MFRRSIDSVMTFLAILVAAIVGIALAIFSFATVILPKRDAKARKEADQRANEMKKAAEAAQAKRADEAKFVIADIEKKAEETKKQDSVALANDLLKD